MAKKGHELGGQRVSKKRHAGELGAGGALALLIVSYLPEGFADPFQTNLLSVVLTAVFSTAAKALREVDVLRKMGIGGLVVVLLSSGCALTMGEIEPREFTGVQGETIVACEIRGVSLAVGDGGTCATVEGGQVSAGFVDVVLGLVESAGRIVGGIFTGIGGIGAAVSPGDAGAS